MGWLRNLERFIEKKIEGKGERGLHALEVMRIASRLILDSRFSPHSGLTVVPNLVIVPVDDKSKISNGFETEVALLLKEFVEQRAFKTLAPLQVRTIEPSFELKDIDVEWMDIKGRGISGMVEALEGPASGKFWGIVEDGSIVGRGTNADIHLIDSEVSRQHLLITPQSDGCFNIEDLGSHNGTRVKKRIVTKVRVKSGEIIYIGGSVLQVWSILSKDGNVR